MNGMKLSNSKIIKQSKKSKIFYSNEKKYQKIILTDKKICGITSLKPSVCSSS